MKQFEQVLNKNEERFYSIVKIETLFTTTSYKRRERKETMVSHLDMEYEPIIEHQLSQKK
jgi:hypothetical protein